jgi:hypothetical protein
MDNCRKEGIKKTENVSIALIGRPIKYASVHR